MFNILEALQEQINEINDRYQDTINQSSKVDDLVNRLKQVSDKTDKTHMEILHSAQSVVQGLIIVSGGQVNEERLFQEMRALKATMVENLSKKNTSSGHLDEDTLAEIRGAVRDSRGDKGGGDSRREEISLGLGALKATIEESLSKLYTSSGPLDGDTLTEIKNAMQKMQIDKGRRDNQQDEGSERVFQEIRALRATVEETSNKSRKPNRSSSENLLAEINDAVQELRTEKAQRGRLAKEKCQKMKAQRDEQVLQNLGTYLLG